MSYHSVVEMSKSPGLRARLVGAAAQAGRADAEVWVTNHIWTLVKSVEWENAWEAAELTKTVNENPDTGARNDVITDEMILSAVETVIEETDSQPGNAPTQTPGPMPSPPGPSAPPSTFPPRLPGA